MNEALSLWIEITGISPNDSKIRLKDLDIHRANDYIKSALQFDSSQITSLMLLESYLDDFVEERSVFLKDILSKFDEVLDWLNKIHKLKGILSSDEAIEIKTSFKESIRQALLHYKVNPDVIETILGKDKMLTEIRYSAFRAMNKLEVVQFSHGEASQKPPVLYENVYQFKDVNTLLGWMMSVDSGIMLALIMDTEQASSSYFAFAIRNGGTLTLVTDRAHEAHPLHKKMSRVRASGRSFFERIDQNYFPYSLMDIKYGDNMRAYVGNGINTLVEQKDGRIMEEIRLLKPDEVVWLSMMFSLLSEKFFKKDFKTRELVYTTKMMVESELLLTNAKENGIVVHGYQPLVVHPLTREDMKTENFKPYLRNSYGREPSGQHDWMIERYELPDETYDVLSDVSVLRLTDGNQNENGALSLEKMERGGYGSIEQLMADRLFLARYNQASAINVLLKKEYDEKIDEVREWFMKAIDANLPRLYQAIAERSFIVTHDVDEARINGGGYTKKQPDGNILHLSSAKGESFSRRMYSVKGQSSNYLRTTCAVNDSTAFIVATFHPSTAGMIADLCGCKVEDLPDLIRHWRNERIDTGNHILERLDPMDWHIENPWEETSFDVRVYLSKSGFNALCKEYKTGNERFWINRKEEYENM